MSSRTTPTLVQALLGANYGYAPDGTLPDLQQYIDTANVIVTRAAALAVSNKGITLSTAELELMERWLSAHFYTKMDPTYSSRSTQGGSGSFVRGSAEPEPYKDGAINVDYSGSLAVILKRQFAGVVWLGKPVSSQIPYDDRG